jgi:hypothetical protein
MFQMQNSSNSFVSEAKKQHMIQNMYKLSCRSKLLAELFPNISAATHIIPEFIHAEACNGNCTKGKFLCCTLISTWDRLRKPLESLIKLILFPDATSWRGIKDKKLPEKRQHMLTEGSNLTLVCPE